MYEIAGAVSEKLYAGRQRGVAGSRGLNSFWRGRVRSIATISDATTVMRYPDAGP